MSILNIILTCLCFGVIGVGLYWARVNYVRSKINLEISQDLDRIIKSTAELIRTNKKNMLHPKISSIEDLYNTANKTTGANLTDPHMLSSLITVIVHKYGTAKLSVQDFLNVSKEEYISVYVDTTAKELILSLNHDLGGGDPVKMASFTNSDDNTFH